MLYKKVHRQFLRHYWEGREVKDKYNIYIYIFGKLRIMKLRFTQYPAITVNCDGVYCPLIYMEGSDKGVIKDYAEWLEDLED